MPRVALALAFLLVVTVGCAPPAAAAGATQATAQPTFSAVAADPVLEPGGARSLTVQIVNEPPDPAYEAATARAVRVELRSGDAPVDVTSGPVVLGDVPNEAVRTATFELTVPRDADAGTYDLPLRVAYRYNGTSGVEREVTTRTDVEVRVPERARLAVVSAETTAAVGESGPVEVVVRNRGTTRARNATVTLGSADADLSFGAGGATTYVGSLGPDETTTVAVRGTVAPDTTVRRLAATATMTYEDADGLTRTDTATFGLTPRARRTVVVREVNSTVPVGGSGTVTLRVEHVGDEPLHAATVSLASADPDLAVGTPEAPATSYVGRWAPGRVERVTYRVGVAEGAVEKRYPLRVTVAGEDEAGRQRTPRTVLAGFDPAPEQTFDVRVAESRLRSGAPGEIVLDVTNGGPAPAEDVVVAVLVDGPNGTAVAAERPVEDLAPGATTTVPVDVSFPRGVGAGRQRVQVAVRYDSPATDARGVDRTTATAEVEPWRPAFAVEPVNATVAVDGEGRLELTTTNDLGEPVTDLTVTVAPADPLSSDDPAAFVGAVEAGGTVRTAHHLEASENAIAGTRPLSVTVAYTDADGVARTAGPYRVPVSVLDPPGTGLPIVPALAVLGVLVLAGVWWYRRRE
ncbi:COG1361 S-layer family protein [Natronomonas marina]|jgi:hypothetical protein|uniref:COG1361 S-layer family protein n=1 Tax=Natronomonas marina TaxID=2961939 RepID=UPI0020CA0C3C|nr:NEW3 domain-containing protein [Natronomonas marina]